MSYRNTVFNPNSFLESENEVLKDRYMRMKAALQTAQSTLELQKILHPQDSFNLDTVIEAIKEAQR